MRSELAKKDGEEQRRAKTNKEKQREANKRKEMERSNEGLNQAK